MRDLKSSRAEHQAVHFTTVNPVRVRVSTVPVPSHSRTSVYGQLIRLLCHQLWMETIVMHQNCNGKYLHTEIIDIRERFH